MGGSINKHLCFFSALYYDQLWLLLHLMVGNQADTRADDFLHECSMTKYERTMDMSHLVEIVLETNDVYS
jgi:hypothetical protein